LEQLLDVLVKSANGLDAPYVEAAQCVLKAFVYLQHDDDRSNEVGIWDRGRFRGEAWGFGASVILILKRVNQLAMRGWVRRVSLLVE